MIDIPLGKCLIPVLIKKRSYGDGDCEYCVLYDEDLNCDGITCSSSIRKDGENVIFKLVDYPVEVKNE